MPAQNQRSASRAAALKSTDADFSRASGVYTALAGRCLQTCCAVVSIFVLWCTGAAAVEVPAAPATPVAAQTGEPAAPRDESTSGSLHDPQDGAIDMSHFLLEKNGFLLVPIFITEPAIGYGGGAGVLFFDQPDQSQASIDRGERLPPNIYGGGLMRTDNGSNAFAAAGKFHFDDDTWRYTGAAGKTSLNLDFYTQSNRKIGYNLDGYFTMHEVARRIGLTPMYVSARWLYADVSNWPDVESELQYIEPQRFDQRSSGLGAGFEYDTRDNTLTPTRGVLASGRATFFLPAIGSNDTYQNYRANIFGYFPFAERWILAARADYRASRGDAPFYVLPSIDLRGIAYGRYQDENAAMLEGELRFKLTPRWSVLGFSGAGRAWGQRYNFGDAPTRSTHGVGIRYTIARALGLDVGLDYARGPDDDAFYIQVGSAWR